MKNIKIARAFLLLLMIHALADAALTAGVVKGRVQGAGKRDGDAVVYLESVPGNYPRASQPASINQYKMQFLPQLLPILVGTTVRFLNSDPTMHNVFTPSKAGNAFNLGTWARGQVKTYTFTQVGEVHVLCSVHPEMEAWILVLANPYFTKANVDGDYTIPGVPFGNYVLKVWHPKLKFTPAQAKVPKDGEVRVDVIGQ